MELVLKSLIISQILLDIYDPVKIYFINNIKKYLLYSIILFITYLIIPSIILFITIFFYYFNTDLNYLKKYNYNIYSSLILILIISDIYKLTYICNKIEKNIFIDTIVKIILFIFLLICFLKFDKYNNLEIIKEIKKCNIIIFINILLIIHYSDNKYEFILYYFSFFHSPLAIIRKSDLYGIYILKYWIYISFILYFIFVLK